MAIGRYFFVGAVLLAGLVLPLGAQPHPAAHLPNASRLLPLPATLNVQPNPAVAYVTVRLQRATIRSAEEHNVTLYNLLGVEMGRGSLREELPGTYTCRLPVAQLATGVYLVRVKDNGQTWTRKFVKSD